MFPIVEWKYFWANSKNKKRTEKEKIKNDFINPKFMRHSVYLKKICFEKLILKLNDGL